MNNIQYWASLVNESYNPDDSKADDLDIAGDKYEQEQKDKEEIEKELAELEKKGQLKIEAEKKEEEKPAEDTEDKGETADTEKPAEDTEKKEDEPEVAPENDEANEAMTPAEIIDQWNNNKEEEQKKKDSQVKTVEIEELYDGYVSGTIIFQSGKSEKFEHEISEEELQDMLGKLEKKATGKYKDVVIGLDDAAIAVIRARLGDKSTDWLFKPTNTDLDDEWVGADFGDIESDSKYDASWADQMGLYANDDGDYGDDDSFKSGLDHEGFDR